MNIPARGPAKKALLIGVKGTDQPTMRQLRQTHKDATIIQELLVKQYQYDQENIVTMLDCSPIKDPDRRPTHANILRELYALVADARPDDQYFFYCASYLYEVERRVKFRDTDSGHADQKRTTDDPSEIDGLDEFILPCDSTGVDDNAIRDNLLKDILIKNLPAGCKLTAVFDACHSGTLLDLDHWRCNRGRLDFSFRRSNQKNLKKRYTSESPLNSSFPQALGMYENQGRKLKLTLQQSGRALGRAFTLNTSIPGIKKRSTAPDTQSPPVFASTTTTTVKILRKIQRTSRSMTINASAMWQNRSLQFGQANSGLNDDNSAIPNSTEKLSPLELPRSIGLDHLTQSPLTLLRPQCNETICREGAGEEDDSVQPLVVVLSACDDAQRAWEAKNTSMTQMLVKMLERNPHPSLSLMMDKLNHEVHDAIVTLQNDARQYQQRLMRYYRRHPSRAKPFDVSDLNLNEEQELQLSSLRPLDMTKILWDP
ncbi:hypothetical protein D9757_000945 [Collybiopsis confluens]|uniref:Peptidase C14 n=1 Tax=Collybiopsis confluens TaxID=2823264 RepID=A0A8H5I0E4_9AGAR|nr:hypothetical protein D9757_000945 [Collybiopsis confluens]